jgi:HAD superfamily hydrolase (TIGR01509 family)
LIVPLFDLGNVLLKLDFSRFLEFLVRNSEVKDVAELKKYMSSSLLADYESGGVSTKGFIERTRLLVRGSFSDAEFEERFADIFDGTIPGMEMVIEELLTAGPVYCLSNTTAIHQARYQRDFPFLKKVTRIYASHEIRARKPYPGTYRDVVAEIGTHPKNVLFFDDLPENIVGAKAAGLQAHVFESAEQVRGIWQGIK